jgi:hypothetical protein
LRANTNSCLVILLSLFTIINLNLKGEASKDKFEGIILSDAASESNFIRSNGVYTAVSPQSHLLLPR